MKWNKVWKTVIIRDLSYAIWISNTWECRDPACLRDFLTLLKDTKHHTITTAQMLVSTEVQNQRERQVNQPFLADTKMKLRSAEPTEALNARPTLKLLDLLNTIHLMNYCSSLIFILSISLNCFASKFCTKISGNGQLFSICSALTQLFYSIIF